MTRAEPVGLHANPDRPPTARDSVGRVAPIAAALLAAWGVDFTIVGSCALVLHGVRTDCNDLDIVPDLAPENIARLYDALRQIATPPVPSLRALSTQSVSSVDGPYGRVDVLADRARAEYESLTARESRCCVEGVEVRIAAIDDVLRLRALYKGAAG